jgi:hypothetical protein
MSTMVPRAAAADKPDAKVATVGPRRSRNRSSGAPTARRSRPSRRTRSPPPSRFDDSLGVAASLTQEANVPGGQDLAPPWSKAPREAPVDPLRTSSGTETKRMSYLPTRARTLLSSFNRIRAFNEAQRVGSQVSLLIGTSASGVRDSRCATTDVNRRRGYPTHTKPRRQLRKTPRAFNKQEGRK